MTDGTEVDTVRDEQPEQVQEVEKTYRPAFSVSMLDTIVYVCILFGGLLCLWFGLNSPSSSIYEMMKAKKPKTDLTHIRMIRYFGWWLFSGGLVTCGGASAAIGALGLLNTVYCVLASILGFFARVLGMGKSAEKDEEKEKEE
eukprot:TRINITY_DN34002_c0_g1_i1.p1 TRINITY_DN34002_c0_g1~~TRINITY_DN34002_c0_g1_i1.p1  ORF type:complete len:158 (+),score=30.00 TRINITY_DN34002_c0_g1_i1:46-474(+)